MRHRINNLPRSYSESLMELELKHRQSASRACTFDSYAMLPPTLLMYSEKEMCKKVNFIAFFA